MKENVKMIEIIIKKNKEGKNIEVLELDNYLIKNDKEILNTFIEKRIKM